MQSLYHIEKAAAQLLSCRYLTDLEQLLEVPRKDLSLLSISTEYYVFTVPKADGSARLIEAPYPGLKKLLRKLNHHLQCVYFLQKPAAAYGYIINYKGNSEPRNMLTNAEQHLGSQYLLNVDFEDFFHQFTKERVHRIFSSAPFRLTARCVEVLTGLCCFKERLPMGSPVSPVLSNFGTETLDQQLADWAASRATYTRFVDDLSFSSHTPFSDKALEEISTICSDHQLHLNPTKTKKYGPGDTKIVTGLEVSHRVSVPGDFYFELTEDIKRLEQTMEASAIMEGDRTSDFVKDFKQQVQGKINFIAMVHGEGSEKYLEYIEKYDKAVSPDLGRLSMRWTDFPYTLP